MKTARTTTLIALLMSTAACATAGADDAQTDERAVGGESGESAESGESGAAADGPSAADGEGGGARGSAKAKGGDRNSGAGKQSVPNDGPDVGAPPPKPAVPLCGTAAAALCDVGQKCATHDDCTSGACSYAGVCLTKAQKSCTSHNGGDTCGAAGNESCCEARAVPTASNVMLDKYNITAGRMRTFVERTNGQIRQWMTANAPAWWNASWNQYLPTQMDSGVEYDGVNQQLGAVIYGRAAEANGACWIGAGQDEIGARTYLVPQAANAATGSVQNYSQDELDKRALNCVSAYMVAAFCAWDGGRLPSRTELDRAWGTAKYPWGTTPKPAGWYTSPASEPQVTPGMQLWESGLSEFGEPKRCTYQPGAANSCDPFMANYTYNYWGGLTRQGNDYSIHIAPPGRFPRGNGPFGHADLGGAVFNVTTISAQGTSQWSKSGSWQGHDLPFTLLEGIKLPATNKYWATGGRCAR